MNEQQRKFMKDQLWLLTCRSAVPRRGRKIFVNSKVSDNRKRALRDRVLEMICEYITDAYAIQRVVERNQIRNIALDKIQYTIKKLSLIFGRFWLKYK